MKFPKPIPVKELANRINASLIGDDGLMATGINQVHQVEKGDITFVDIPKYYEKSLKSDASIIIINKKVECPPEKVLLLVEDPFNAYNDLVIRYRPYQALTTNISPEATIASTAIIEPNVVIGPHVTIGEHSHIQANVTIAEHTIIKDHVLIQSGSVIGTEAFYFKKDHEGYHKWRSGGRVIIEDRVDIGAACTINKGVSGDTIIGEGTKLDAQVHVGHDVRIGKHCLIAAQAGISGNTHIGDEVILYGQVGIAQNLKIGDKVIVSAKSGVSKDLEAGKVYFGYPAAEARTKYKELAALRHLPEFLSMYYK